MQAKLVRQLDKFGCGIACLAMILDVTYEEAKQMFSIFNGAGIYTRQMDEFLASYGFAVARYLKRTFLRGTGSAGRKRTHWPVKPFAPIHLCLVKVKEDSKVNHFIILLKDGTVLDPDKDKAGRIEDYFDVLAIAGVVKING